jgi:type IV secretory pathway TraG/TraD family ATPase VirD4
MNNDYLIAFVRGMSPILARRVKWYEDRAFRRALSMSPKRSVIWWAMVAVIAILCVWAISTTG